MNQPGAQIQEVIVNARIRNSSSRTANCAYLATKGMTDVAARVQKQLEKYQDAQCGGNARHRERWPYMKRPVVAYESLRGK